MVSPEVVKSIFLTALSAFVNSSSNPIMMSVSNESIKVAPRAPSVFLNPAETGSTSSCIQAYFLYPSHECMKASLTAACLCSRWALLCSVSTPNSCCIRGRGADVPLGRRIVEDTGYRWGRSFHLMGRVIGLDEVVGEVGIGCEGPACSVN